MRSIPSLIKSRSGQASILGVSIATGLFFLSLFSYFVASSSARKITMRTQDKLLAEAFASELLEYFRGMSTAALESYLSMNPMTGSAQVENRYYYCSHINLLNRADNVIMNADPLAALPPSRLDQSNILSFNANRWYQVQVVNKHTLEVDPSFCGFRFGQKVITDDQTYMVTVGVTYYNRGEVLKKNSNIQTMWTLGGSPTQIGSCMPQSCSNLTPGGGSGLVRVVLSTILLKDGFNDYPAPNNPGFCL